MTLFAAAFLMVTMGVRQSLGLFVSPMNTTTGLGIVTISLALGIGQFVWGAVQPVAGAFADRFGPARVLATGIVVLAIGMALTPLATSGVALVLTLGVLAAAGSGAGSFSVLIGAAAQRAPAESRGTASGVINAGGSFGQFVFAPVAQKLIAGLGWMGAMWALALITLATLPVARAVLSDRQGVSEPDGGGLRHAVATALSDRSYLLLHSGFSPVGFTLPSSSRIFPAKSTVRTAFCGRELVARDHRPPISPAV